MQINLDKSKKYLLACSFGPDSMALFNLLLDGDYDFGVAHVNYQMRGEESDNETKNLVELLKAKKIRYFANYIDGKDFSGNFQARAREARYDFFKDIMEEGSYDVLLIAHHKDDFLETYLLQRTSNRKSFYYGIKEETTLNGIKIIRPLLKYYKSDILQYCATHNVKYSIDSSNLERKYTRNKIRLDVIDKMSLTQKEELFNEIQALNKTLDDKRIALANYYKDSVKISLFNTLSEEDQNHLLYFIFEQKGFAEYFHSSKVRLIKNNINSAKTSTFMKVVAELYITKHEDDFYLINILDYKPYEYTVNQAKTISFPQFSVYFDKENVIPHIKESEFPITITNGNSDEKYTIDGNTKKLSRVYIDMKMPRHIRLIWPVVKNRYGKIIYIPRYRKDYIPKETDLFKINHL